MPIYMGGSFVGARDDAIKQVKQPSHAEPAKAGDNGDNITVANSSFLSRADTPTESVDLAQAARLDGQGTKYATSNKRKTLKNKSDKRMLVLRQENYSDKDIAKKLEEEFGLVLQVKSIASRLPKLQKRKEEEDDQRLDEEMGDWHVGEDEKLYQAYGEVEKKINAKIAELEGKKWSEVSRYLADKMPERKYTGKACKERFDGLLDGTAELPIELDPDQERRRFLRETRNAETKRVRTEAEAAAIRAIEAVHEAKEQKRLQQLQVKQERHEQAAAVKAEKELDKQLKMAVANAKANEVENKRAAQQQERQRVAEKEREQELENIVYNYYTGKYLQKRHRVVVTKPEDQEEYLSDQEGIADALKVSKKSLENPRSIMSLHELDLLLAERNMPRRAADETQPQVVARLAAADMTIPIPALDLICKAKFVRLKDNREIKTAKLQAADAKESAAGKEGTKATDLAFKRTYEGYQGKGARFLPQG